MRRARGGLPFSELFKKAGLSVESVYKPLGKKEEPFNWISEMEIAPWIIFVLNKTAKS